MQQIKKCQQLANLHLNAGGAVIVSNREPDLIQHLEPSGGRQFLVFGGVLGLLVAGAIAGYFVSNSANQKALQEAETKAITAKYKLQQNQDKINEFCRLNSSFGSE